MEVMDVALKRQEASLLTIQEEHADRLKQQESGFASRLETEEKRLQQLVVGFYLLYTELPCEQSTEWSVVNSLVLMKHLLLYCQSLR